MKKVRSIKIACLWRLLAILSLLLFFRVTATATAASMDGGNHARSLQRKTLEYRQACRETIHLLSFLQRIIEEEGTNSLSGGHFRALAEVIVEFIEQTSEMLEIIDRLPGEFPDFEEQPLLSLQWLTLQVMVGECFTHVYEDVSGNKETRRFVHSLILKANLELWQHLQSRVFDRWQGRKTTTALLALKTYLQESAAGQKADVFTANPEAMIYLDWLQNSASWKLVADNQCVGSMYSGQVFLSDSVSQIIGGVKDTISLGMGTLMILVNWRQGYLRDHEDAMAELKQSMQPLDLLNRKRRFSLASYVIPGYWGHSAIWLGSEQQLRDLGLWGHPAVRPFQNEIAQGRSVYEVRYNGVRFVSLEDFFNLDEVAVVRVAGLEADDSSEMIAVFDNLAEHLNKKYDYSFNVMRPDRIVCTELVLLSFKDINWPKRRLLGRLTMLPDDLLELLFYRESPLQFVAYYAAHQHHSVEVLDLPALAATVDAGILAEPEKVYAKPVPAFVFSDRELGLEVELENGGVWFYPVSRRRLEHRRYQPPRAIPELAE